MEEQVFVINPVEEFFSRFLDVSGKRNRFPVGRILEERPLGQQGVFFLFHPVQEKIHIIFFIIIGKIEEMMFSQTAQNTGHAFSCKFRVPFVFRIGADVADEPFLTAPVNEQIGSDENFCFPGIYDGTLFLPDGRPEGDVGIMDGHLPFQFLPGCPDGTQPCKAASTHIEAERIDIAAVRLTYEKEMPCLPDYPAAFIAAIRVCESGRRWFRRRWGKL